MMKPIHIACTKVIKEALKQEALQYAIDIEDFEVVHTSACLSDTIQQYLDNPNYTYIFTSSKAVEYFLAYPKDRTTGLTNACFAINGATADALRNTTLNIVDTAKDAQHLAEKIVLHQPKQLVHFTSDDHRQELYRILDEHNIVCDTCIIYKKQAQSKIFKSFDAVLFFSPSQVDAFLSAQSISSSTPAFCIGNTTANHIKTKGHGNIIIASQPTQEALLKEVYQYFNINT